MQRTDEPRIVFEFMGQPINAITQLHSADMSKRGRNTALEDWIQSHPLEGGEGDVIANAYTQYCQDCKENNAVIPTGRVFTAAINAFKKSGWYLPL